MSYAPGIRAVPSKSTGTATSVRPAFMAGLPKIKWASWTGGVAHNRTAARYEPGVRVYHISVNSKAKATRRPTGHTGRTVDNIIGDGPRDRPRHRIHEPLIWLVADIILNQ